MISMYQNPGRTHARRPAALLGLLLLLSGPRLAHGADTVEPYDRGLSDFELYLGYDGVGHPLDAHTLAGDVALGIGITDRFSFVAGTTVQGYRRMRAGDAAVSAGLLGTVLDTDHVDLDLIVSLGLGGAGLRGVTFTPAFELNVDRKPDLAAYGLYLRGALVLAVDGVDGSGDESTFVHHYVLTAGAYVTLGRRHQILLEFDSAYHPTLLSGERHFDLGGLALGYNVRLAPWAELITQVYVNLPQDDERPSVGFLTGVIFTRSSGKG